MPRLDSFLLSRSARVGQSSDPLWGIIFSLLVASVLTVYPVPDGLAGFRPLFMLLVMLFWVLCQPVWCGMWFAFFMGLACDLMLDSALGQHAFSFVVIAFAARFVAQNRRVLTFLNLWILAAATSLIHLIIMFILQKFSGMDLALSHWSSWLPSVLVWPFLVHGLKRWRT